MDIDASYRRQPSTETDEQYEARVRRNHEEQLAAQERRAKEDAERKLRVEKEREKGQHIYLILNILKIICPVRTGRGGGTTKSQSFGEESQGRGSAQGCTEGCPDPTAKGTDTSFQSIYRRSCW
jgi:hypothetical protein